MSLFKKNLGMLLSFTRGDDEEIKLQTMLEEVVEDAILVNIPEKKPELYKGLEVMIKIYIRNVEFWFTTTISDLINEGGSSVTVIKLDKPKVIHKKKLRKADRMSVSLPAKVSPWTESGVYEAEILDLSITGCKVKCKQRFEAGKLLSLSTYISDGRHRIRLMSQAVVSWNKIVRLKYSEEYYMGAIFTTISNSNVKKLEDYIGERMGVAGRETYSNVLDEVETRYDKL